MAFDAVMNLSQSLAWSGLVTFKQYQLTARFSLTGIEPVSCQNIPVCIVVSGYRLQEAWPLRSSQVAQLQLPGVQKEQFWFLVILLGKKLDQC